MRSTQNFLMGNHTKIPVSLFPYCIKDPLLLLPSLGKALWEKSCQIVIHIYGCSIAKRASAERMMMRTSAVSTLIQSGEQMDHSEGGSAVEGAGGCMKSQPNDVPMMFFQWFFHHSAPTSHLLAALMGELKFASPGWTFHTKPFFDKCVKCSLYHHQLWRPRIMPWHFFPLGTGTSSNAVESLKK